MGSLLSLNGSVGTALLQTGLLSLVVEGLLLASPFYLQFVVDDATLKGDSGLVQVLALAFGFLTVFRVAAMMLRGLTTQFVSSVLAYDMKGRIFHHMVRLPLDWFQKRQITEAREQTRFLETLRAAQTIKAAGSERVRESQYRNAAAASINAQIRSGNISLGTMAADQLLNGLTEVLVIYVGARAVIAGHLTIGMLTAFLAYKGQLVARFTNLVEQLFAWRLLDLQLERLADVVLSPKEERIDDGGHDGIVDGHLECRGLIFRYAFGEPLVLRGPSLSIKSGECVAIVGPSGCGKSTLAKLLTGLYQPSAGEVLIDGRPLTHWSKKALRAQISYVSQDDQLLAGSIAENITFFAEQIDMERVHQCACLAFVHDEIAAMPMGYQSLVGDMGSSLSGGQKQRIIIARALYRRPRILVMDEATAHLDITNERAIAKALADLTITRIVIAHRPETIAAADRVISFDPV